MSPAAEISGTASQTVLNLLSVRRGHFLLESGHHGDLWLDLESLCLRPRLLQPMAAEMASRLLKFDVEVVCGPLIEGAFAGLMVASELGVYFTYSERVPQPSEDGLFPAGYRIPRILRKEIQHKRVAIVTDVINAGSALRGTFQDLRNCGARIVAIGALLILGTAASEFAAGKNVALDALAALPNELWTASACPLCSSGVPLEDLAGFRTALHKRANAPDLCIAPA